MKHFRSLSLQLGLLCISSCALDLPVASTIEHMRILTAIAVVDGDMDRSSPKPGETAHVTWEIAWPDPKKDNAELATMFYTCTAPSVISGAPVLCQEVQDLLQAAINQRGDPAAITKMFGGFGTLQPCADAPNSTLDFGPLQVVCVTGTPELDIRIPDTYKADAKLIQGATCRNGTPGFNPKNPLELICTHAPGAKDTEEISFYGTVPIQQKPESQNDNPRTDALTLKFGDPPLLWELTDAAMDAELGDEECDDLARDKRVMSSDGTEETIELQYDAKERELSMGKPEALTFSAYTTYGEISDRFTVFRSDAKTPLKRTITWQLSDEQREQLKKSSKYVRFYFTISDGRGGYAITHRDLCAVR